MTSSGYGSGDTRGSRKSSSRKGRASVDPLIVGTALRAVLQNIQAFDADFAVDAARTFRKRVGTLIPEARLGFEETIAALRDLGLEAFVDGAGELEGVAAAAGINFGEGDEARRQLRLWTGPGSDFGVLDEATFIWVAWRGRRFVDAAEMLWPLWSALDTKKIARVGHHDIDKALSAAGSAVTSEGLGLEHLQAEVLELFKYHAGDQDAIVFADFLALVCDMQDRFALAQIAGKEPLLCRLRYDRGLAFLRPKSAHVFAPPDDTAASPDTLDSPPPLADARSSAQQLLTPQPELAKAYLASKSDAEINVHMRAVEGGAYPAPQEQDSSQAAHCTDASRPEAKSLPQPRLLMRSCAEREDQIHEATPFETKKASAERLLGDGNSGPVHVHHRYLQRRMRAPSEVSDDVHWPLEHSRLKEKRASPAAFSHQSDQASSSSQPASLMFRSSHAEGSVGSRVLGGLEKASGQKQDYQSIVPSDVPDLPSVYPRVCAEAMPHEQLHMAALQRRPPLAPAEASELSEEEALKLEQRILKPHDRTAYKAAKTTSPTTSHWQEELQSSTVHTSQSEYCFHDPRSSPTPTPASTSVGWPGTRDRVMTVHAKQHHALLAPPEPSDDSDGTWGLAGKHVLGSPYYEVGSLMASRMHGQLASPSASSSVSRRSRSGPLPFTEARMHTGIPCASLDTDDHLQKNVCRLLPSEPEHQMNMLRERGQLTLWQEVTDPRSGLTYWWNRSTNETTHVGAPKPHPGPPGKMVASAAALDVRGREQHAVGTGWTTPERKHTQQPNESCRSRSAGPVQATAQTMAHSTLRETHPRHDKERFNADTGSEGGPDLAALSHSRHAAAEDEDTGTGGTLGTSHNGGEGFEDEGDAVEADAEGSGESDLEW